MTVRFANHRLGFYVAIFLLSGTVLGLAVHFAILFLPTIHHNFSIFSIIVPSLTILVFLILLQSAQPRIEVWALFLLGILWLTMAAWSNDIIGTVQCDGLGGQRTATKHGDMSAAEYCYEMKVIQAFSWATFVFMAIAIIILFVLCTQAQRLGRPLIWAEPIRELGWFGEFPGFYNTHSPGVTQAANGYTQAYPQQYPAYPAQYPGGQYFPQSGGHVLTIQHGVNGAPPIVTSTPLST